MLISILSAWKGGEKKIWLSNTFAMYAEKSSMRHNPEFAEHFVRFLFWLVVVSQVVFWPLWAVLRLFGIDLFDYMVV